MYTKINDVREDLHNYVFFTNLRRKFAQLHVHVSNDDVTLVRVDSFRSIDGATCCVAVSGKAIVILVRGLH